jgi:hypothetical protein
MIRVRFFLVLLGGMIILAIIWLIGGAIDNSRWVEKEELAMPSLSFETCLKRVIDDLHDVSIVDTKYGSYQLVDPLQRGQGFRIYIQRGDGDKAILMIVSDNAFEPLAAKGQFHFLQKRMSTSVQKHCGDLE